MTAKVMGVVLAAGRSRRFGARDKLVARTPGASALVLKPARALQGLGLMRSAAVTSGRHSSQALHGAHLDHLPIRTARAQSTSLHRALRAARMSGASHLLIVLGDMPGITRNDLRDVLATPGPHPAMASCSGRLSPPTLIPRRLFSRLLRLRGDRGAGMLLRQFETLRHVALSEETLRDVDMPGDLTAEAPRSEVQSTLSV